MHIVRYIYYPQTQNQVNPTNISSLKIHVKLAPRDVSTMKTALKMRQFSRVSWFEQIIDSIHSVPFVPNKLPYLLLF